MTKYIIERSQVQARCKVLVITGFTGFTDFPGLSAEAIAKADFTFL